jgi:hypothetical protein
VAGCCECGDEPSGSCATELVIMDGGCVLIWRVAVKFHVLTAASMKVTGFCDIAPCFS